MKVFALLLGPAGVGLVGVYHSVMSTAATAAGMGVSSSGVRQIADAYATGDASRAANARRALSALTMFLAMAGLVVLFLLRERVSMWVFGNRDHVVAVVVLAVGVPFTVISGSQMAVLNGLRRIGDLTRSNLLGTSLAAAVAILIVWSYGESAVAPSITTSAIVAVMCSWWFVRQVPRPQAVSSSTGLGAEVRSLLQLGLAFMFAGLVITVTLLVTRMIFLDRFGLAATGYFQAAWAIAVFNVDFVLRAMGVDFYPHLTACINDRFTAHRLVNEQTEIALLASGPVLIGTLAFAPLLIRIFYSADFDAATDLLRWLLLGNILKIASWPLGYLIMARAWARVSFLTELVWSCSYLACVYVWSAHFGINAAGYAFVTAYSIFIALLYCINHFALGFKWSPATLRLTVSLLVAGIIVMAIASRDDVCGYLVGGLIACGLGVFSIKGLWKLVDAERRTARSLRADE